MNLAQALKQKNRLVGEANRLLQIFSRENSRKDNTLSKVKPDEIWEQYLKIINELIEIKTKITIANINIYPSIVRMEELKARIGVILNLNKTEGEIAESYDRVTGKEIKVNFSAFINQDKADELIQQIQVEINELQDKIDSYNATTQIQ